MHVELSYAPKINNNQFGESIYSRHSLLIFFHTFSNMSDVVNDLLDLHDVIQLADNAMLLAEYLESLCVQVCCYFLVIKG